jgi:hypothetical protein
MNVRRQRQPAPAHYSLLSHRMNKPFALVVGGFSPCVLPPVPSEGGCSPPWYTDVPVLVRQPWKDLLQLSWQRNADNRKAPLFFWKRFKVCLDKDLNGIAASVNVDANGRIAEIDFVTSSVL